MLKFTSEEIVMILTCFAHRQDTIRDLRKNPYVDERYKMMLDKDLILMESVKNKLHPRDVGVDN